MQTHYSTRSIFHFQIWRCTDRSRRQKASLELRDLFIFFIIIISRLQKCHQKQTSAHYLSKRRRSLKPCAKLGYQLTFDGSTLNVQLVVAAAAEEISRQKKNQFRSRLSLLLFHRNERNKNFLLPFCTNTVRQGVGEYECCYNGCLRMCVCVCLLLAISGTIHYNRTRADAFASDFCWVPFSREHNRGTTLMTILWVS